MRLSLFPSILLRGVLICITTKLTKHKCTKEFAIYRFPIPVRMYFLNEISHKFFLVHVYSLEGAYDEDFSCGDLKSFHEWSLDATNLIHYWCRDLTGHTNGDYLSRQGNLLGNGRRLFGNTRVYTSARERASFRLVSKQTHKNERDSLKIPGEIHAFISNNLQIFEKFWGSECGTAQVASSGQ